MTEGQRGLLKGFRADLKNPDGQLHWILQRVRVDRTLCLEIRENYLNIYYRGCSLMNVQVAGDSYSISLDDGYLEEVDLEQPPKDDLEQWRVSVPLLKDAVDLAFFKKKRSLEREFQQLVVWENNLWTSTDPDSNSTDYFVCDQEYDNRRGAKFDLVAVRWPSRSAERKKDRDLRLALVEMKYGDGSLQDNPSKKTAGIEKHASDFLSFIQDGASWPAFADEMKCLFNQKLDLGIIKCKKPIVSFSETPEVLFLLANHDPDSTILREVLGAAQPKIDELVRMGVRVAFTRAAYCGYALFEDQFIQWDELRRIL